MLSTTNPYGSTKLIIEDMLRDIAKADSSFNIVILRYFNSEERIAVVL